MKHEVIESKYWNTTERGILNLKRNILSAISHLEDYEDFELEVAIVDIHIEDRWGIYIPRTLYCMMNDVREEDYPFELGSEEEVWEMDKLMGEVDEELKMVVEHYGILPSGYGIQFGWFDGGICSVIYTIS